ncbi:hypothetical protein JVT61DRAFT_9937 [Boletus reticuloceps]|uniref:Uncharacterized protein n=1 Tax=Boletus reticuloceps TaxID=495285 RepID=A0A8I2YFZ8_9AGAM|nr:hypothetical protein JVT61DRAFT_9937 [Boletus reticuloceps]
MLVYLEMLEKNHWILQLKLLKGAFSAGHSYNSLKLALSKPGITVYSLPKPPPLQPGDNVVIGIGLASKPDFGANLPEFSLSVMQDCLVDFIVTNDEAINIIECPAFY